MIEAPLGGEDVWDAACLYLSVTVQATGLVNHVLWFDINEVIHKFPSTALRATEPFCTLQLYFNASLPKVKLFLGHFR